jgi:predicted nuclease of predicted toxin-antitoxin system
MRMLFFCDVHIPPSLAAALRAWGFEAAHVLDLGLETASDQAIWSRAREEDAIVVTKDRDFVQLAISQPGPRLVLVCIGNSTSRVLRDKFSELLPEVLNHFSAGQRVVELR